MVSWSYCIPSVRHGRVLCFNFQKFPLTFQTLSLQRSLFGYWIPGKELPWSGGVFSFMLLREITSLDLSFPVIFIAHLQVVIPLQK